MAGNSDERLGRLRLYPRLPRRRMRFPSGVDNNGRLRATTQTHVPLGYCAAFVRLLIRGPIISLRSLRLGVLCVIRRHQVQSA